MALSSAIKSEILASALSHVTPGSPQTKNRKETVIYFIDEALRILEEDNDEDDYHEKDRTGNDI